MGLVFQLSLSSGLEIVGEFHCTAEKQDSRQFSCMAEINSSKSVYLDKKSVNFFLYSHLSINERKSQKMCFQI